MALGPVLDSEAADYYDQAKAQLEEASASIASVSNVQVEASKVEPGSAEGQFEVFVGSGVPVPFPRELQSTGVSVAATPASQTISVGTSLPANTSNLPTLKIDASGIMNQATIGTAPVNGYWSINLHSSSVFLDPNYGYGQNIAITGAFSKNVSVATYIDNYASQYGELGGTNTDNPYAAITESGYDAYRSTCFITG